MAAIQQNSRISVPQNLWVLWSFHSLKESEEYYCPLRFNQNISKMIIQWEWGKRTCLNTYLLCRTAVPWLLYLIRRIFQWKLEDKSQKWLRKEGLRIITFTSSSWGIVLGFHTQFMKRYSCFRIRFKRDNIWPNFKQCTMHFKQCDVAQW